MKVSSKLKTTAYIKYNKEREQELSDYINNVFADINCIGFIGLGQELKDGFKRPIMNINSANRIVKYTGREQVYMCLNPFCHNKGEKQIEDKVLKINAVYVDLDYYKMDNLQGLPPTDVLNLISMEYPTMPKPSIVQDSGNGMYLIWLLDNTNASRKAKDFARKLMSTITKKLKRYGADPQCTNLSRVLRLPYTINGKTGRLSYLIENNYQRYSLKDMAEWLWEIDEINYIPTTETRAKATDKVINISSKKKTISSLNWSRAVDVDKLIDLRGGKCNGYRELMLFIGTLHFMYATRSSQEAQDYINNLNSKFTKPLGKNVLKTIIRECERVTIEYYKCVDDKSIYDNNVSKCYKYKNETIIELLDITSEEQQQMNVLIGTEERKQRKSKRNKADYQARREEQGKLSREEKKALTQEKVSELIQQGYKQTEISKILGIGIATVKRYVKIINESNSPT